MAEFHEQVIVVQALALAGVTFSGSLNGCKLTKGQAGKAKAAGIDSVAFDRAGYRYHGRVKALAEAARAGGLKF